MATGTIETRTNRRRVEVRAEGDAAPEIVGYAAVYYRAGDPGTEYWLWDDIVERIMPGAFDRAIREDDVRALFNHDPNLILGRTASGTLALSVDAVGLAYRITPPRTAFAEHAVEAVRRGDVSGSSFAMIPAKTVWIEEQDEAGRVISIREIHDINQLRDISPVTYPAYEGTSSDARSSSGQPSRRNISEEKRADLDAERAAFFAPRDAERIAREEAARRAALA